MKFVCPVCRQELLKKDNSCYCADGHCFDCAKSGYVNLLRTSSGGNHGDNKLMINARRDFLEKGYYEKFRDAVSEVLAEYCKPDGTVLDCGCGEGYYTRCFKERMPSAELCALDISKHALKLASSRSKDIDFAVASSFDIPLPDGSVDALVEIFSPFCRAEFARVLKPGAYLIMALPLENHLIELKSAVYDTPYKNEPGKFEIDGFEFLEKKDLKYKVNITDNSDIKNLFMMTPYYYKTGEENQSRLNTLQQLELSLEFCIAVYKKCV